ncbi:MAG TPA: T9SS type A sorting domain-containing protein, partial [Prolixibacteraceae bacterium]|nr:T9SS type A sorting domain-containing protein [Prolixibacteraceae bacterium]
MTNDSLIIKGAGTAFINITNSGNDHWQQLDTLIVLEIEKGIQLQNAPDSLVIAFSNNAFIMPLEVNSNLEIEYELNGDVLALANGQFSTLKTGTERVRVFSNGDDNWHEFEHFVEVIVEKGKQYIEFESLPQYSFNQLGVQLNALSSSGLPIFFVLSDTTVVQMISADSLVFHTSGMVTITATQPGNDNWFEAPSVARQLIIDKAEQSITTALNDTLLVGQAFSWADFQASSGLNISNIKSSNNELISVSADSFNVLSIGNVVLTVTQQGDMRYHPVAVDFNFVGTNKTANNESKNIWFALYPNPASSFVVFEYNGQINGNEYVEIHDTSGRLLLLRHLSSNTIRFDLSGLLPGLYFVK